MDDTIRESATHEVEERRKQGEQLVAFQDAQWEFIRQSFPRHFVCDKIEKFWQQGFRGEKELVGEHEVVDACLRKKVEE
jgi:hypothetical protein